MIFAVMIGIFAAALLLAPMVSYWKVGLLFAFLATLSTGALVWIEHTHRKSAALLWCSAFALASVAIASLCLGWHFALWADKKWGILANWEWPRPKHR